MSESPDWSFPDPLTPDPGALAFDLDRALDAVVRLKAEVPEHAFTAGTLGTERGGNGVVIDPDGLVLTIGYLVTEASTVWLTTNAGKVVEAYPLAYDQASGFGLVRALGALDTPCLARGTAADIAIDDPLIVIGHGGRQHALSARLADRRVFAGYWEYLLEAAMFTEPAHPEWSGAALLDMQGRLVGIGSLLVQEQSEDETAAQGNMMVPIDLLEPILPDLLETGRASGPPRPWLGMYVTEIQRRLVVAGTAADGPGEKAGAEQGDIVASVAGHRPASLGDFLRMVWSLGPAGTVVPMDLLRDGETVSVTVETIDRNDMLRRAPLQ